jgi:hypothetical protein
MGPLKPLPALDLWSGIVALGIVLGLGSARHAWHLGLRIAPCIATGARAVAGHLGTIRVLRVFLELRPWGGVDFVGRLPLAGGRLLLWTVGRVHLVS